LTDEIIASSGRGPTQLIEFIVGEPDGVFVSLGGGI
jgi:hypothetical protein